MAEDFYSFENALKKLKLREEELRRLVSEGEIRAYRSGETMKLRKEDVEKLESELNVSGGDVVELEDDTEELVFAEEEPTEIVDDVGMSTEKISAEDTLEIEEVEQAMEPDVEEVTPVARPARSMRASARRTAVTSKSRRTPTAAGATTEERTAEPNLEGPLWRFCLLASAAALLLGVVALVNLAGMEESGAIGWIKGIGSIFG